MGGEGYFGYLTTGMKGYGIGKLRNWGIRGIPKIIFQFSNSSNPSIRRYRRGRYERAGKIHLEKIDDYRWRIPKTGKMRVDGVIYADERLLQGDS